MPSSLGQLCKFSWQQLHKTFSIVISLFFLILTHFMHERQVKIKANLLKDFNWMQCPTSQCPPSQDRDAGGHGMKLSSGLYPRAQSFLL